jgi:outer membrane assembly lipoprotein YfgL
VNTLNKFTYSSLRKAIGSPIAVLSVFITCLLALGACSSNKVKPLQPQQDIKVVWSTELDGEINYPATLSIVNDQIATATSTGSVALLNVKNGSIAWKTKIKGLINAGAGFDGTRVAVVTQDNDLVVIENGKVLWQQNLSAQSFTAPVVAGLRVFVLLADRSVVAFDGASGKKLWTQQRTGDALVLKQAGVLAPFHNTLIAGLGARLTGLDPLTGKILWEAPLANPRGINDLERLVDLVGPLGRVGDVVCTRAFQAQIGCVDAELGKLIWTRPSFGEEGLSVEGNQLVSIESNGQILSWSVNNGDRLWDRDAFKSHHLTAPLIMSKGIFLGDAVGWVYLLSKKDGAVLNRLPIGSSRGFASAPTAIDAEHMVIATKNGVVNQYYTP